MANDYQIVRNELELYNKDILNKPEVIVLTKVDILSEEERRQKLEALKLFSGFVFPFSIIDDALVARFGEYLTREYK